MISGNTISPTRPHVTKSGGFLIRWDPSTMSSGSMTSYGKSKAARRLQFISVGRIPQPKPTCWQLRFTDPVRFAICAKTISTVKVEHAWTLTG